MKQIFTAALILICSLAKAQFGYQPKDKLESLKEMELIVVLNDDSTDLYNTSIEKAVHNYWKYTSAKFVKSAGAMEYAKKKEGGYIYLILVKGVGAKIKSRCMSSELETTTGLLIVTKYKKGKAMLADIAASGMIDSKFGYTPEEYDAQFIRAVQFLQNYFDYLAEAPNDKAIEEQTMKKRYPGDKTLADGKKLLVDKKMVEDDKQKEEIGTTYAGDVEFVDAKTIAAAINAQDENIIYWAAPNNEADSHRMFVTAKDSKILMYNFTSGNNFFLTGKDISKLMKR